MSATAKKRKAKAAVSVAGRIGHKRSDMRYRDETGTEWASKLESDVYEWLTRNAASARKAESGRDSVAYQTAVRGGTCGECGCTRILQNHTYTPDIFAVDAWPNKPGPVTLEVKGFLRAKDKRILRAVVKAGVISNMCLLFGRRHDKTVEWAKKFLPGVALGIFAKGTIEAI